MTELNKALNTLTKAVDDTHIDVYVDGKTIQIHWFGVAGIDCTPATAAKVIPALKQLEIFGMKSV